MKYILTIFLFFSILKLKGQYVQRRLNEVDSLLNDLTRKDLFSGTVLIADSSGIILSKGYGYSDREKKILNTVKTKFDLSSGSKIFTGTAIVHLAQLGKLKFTDKIEKYIEGLPKGHLITLHQILTHSAGFDDFCKAKDFTYENVKNCSDIIPFMRKLPLVYEPGDSCIYSTGDLIILGAVIEKITGLEYTQYIKDTFIKPLRLSKTSFLPYRYFEKKGQPFAIGYYKDSIMEYSRIPYDYDNWFIPLSAGGAWSNVIDLWASLKTQCIILCINSAVKYCLIY